VRFFLDNDVPVSVGRMLRRYGHTCWTAANAGLADEGQDDNLSVYADVRDAVLITLDRESTLRRRRNPIGRHVRLRCPEPEAVALLAEKLGEVLAYLQREHVTVSVSKYEVKADSASGVT
jgi:predicted nuclease of predicted toxin-antitoxin system